ncbi:MAG: ribosome maturation factor RimP [Oscillospiraceae bacterium]|nr:ribosome maturation factor RimP [Oscillospiraceae bacterium]
MGKNNISLVKELALPIVESRQLILWDLVLEKEGSDWFLRVVIDGDRPVELDDCEYISRKLDKLLDEHDPIEQSYILEVSSAGIGRRLKKPRHLDAYVGRAVEVLFIRAVEGQRDYTGILLSHENGQLKIDTSLYGGNGELEFAIKDTSYIKAADDLEELTE